MHASQGRAGTVMQLLEVLCCKHEHTNIFWIRVWMSVWCGEFGECWCSWCDGRVCWRREGSATVCGEG